MTRRMSCSLTIAAVRARTKTVTRRHVDTWKNLKPSDRLTLIEKGMGLPKGSHQVVLAEVEIVDVRIEPLMAMWQHDYGMAEVEREGVTGISAGPDGVPSPNLFTYWWADSHGYGRARTPSDLHGIDVRRIEWRYLDA